ncbi:MAG: hypothetical protein ACHRXM_09595 [Isosphaerales bacterium]
MAARVTNPVLKPAAWTTNPIRKLLNAAPMTVAVDRGHVRDEVGEDDRKD